MMFILEALVASLLIAHVHGQTLQGAFGDSLLCNGSFDQANATGVFTINPDVDQGPQTDQQNNTSGKTLPVDIVQTVIEDRNKLQLQRTIWINPRGANYSDDFSLGYDLCGMVLSYLPNNTVYRAQKDNGSCYQTFDQPCVNAINQAAQQYALELTLNPTPYPDSNLTADSLPTVCNDIATFLTANIPKECSNYLDSSAQVTSPTPLTGYNSSVIYAACTANQSYNDAYYAIETQFAETSPVNLGIITQTPSPILLIWMPIANAARPSYIQYATAELVCVHINSYREGSTIPAALPEPTPVGGSTALSGGTIAGIVVAVVAGVALIAGAAVWFFMKKRRAKKNEKAKVPMPGTNGDEKNALQEPQSAITAPDIAASELPPDAMLSELDGEKEAKRHELGSDFAAKEIMSKESTALPVELEGSAPGATK